MRKILIFLLILASFSCTTLDSNIATTEKKDVIDRSKKESSLVVPDENVAINKIEEVEKPKENVTPTTESLKLPDIQQEEDKKTLVNSSNTVENEEKKEENKEDEKKDIKNETNGDVISKNDEKVSFEAENKEVEEEEKTRIADESALQDYSDLFSESSRVEPKKEEKKEEQKKILPSLEILKELEDSVVFFQKRIPNVVRQHVGKTQDVVEKEKPIEAPEGENQISEVTTTEDENALSNVQSADSSNEENAIVDFDDNAVSPSFNEDNEPKFDFSDEEHELSFEDEESQFNFGYEEPQFTFDDEREGEIADKQNGENKGELSSVVDEEDKVNISRYTNILKGQNIDFSYPGEGWVYLGEETSQKGLSYVKRKMENGKTFFTFTAENEGNYVLNFSYFDVFSGDFIVDAVSVKVIPNNDGVQKDSLVLEYQGKGAKKADDKPAKKIPNEVNVDADKVGINTEDTTKKEEASPKQPASKSAVDSNMQTLKPATPSNNNIGNSTYKEPEVFTNIASISPENAKTKVSGEDAKKIIAEVSEAISNGDAKKALERLDDFFAVASTNMDEAYFLRGKAYELNTEQKNIKMALSAYKFLTSTFPNSPLWNEADARIRYIEKFFVKIK